MADAPPPRTPAGRGGSPGPPDRPPSPPQGPPGGRPDYKVYRSRSGPRLGERIGERLAALRGSIGGGPKRPKRPARPPRPGAELEPQKRRITVKRVILAVFGLLLGWIVLSVVLFFISAQTSPGVSPETREALSPGGTMLTGSTILVLGTDERNVPGEEGSGVGRADSIMLLHVAFGNVSRLSILRDSLAAIPGHGEDKINGAFAYGGAPLMIQTVEDFLGNGLEINHLIEVNFKEFPKFIDSLGGVTVDSKSELKAPFFDRAVTAPAGCAPGNGGENGQPPSEGFRMKKGACHLNGDQALTFARIRKNLADPGESDSERAERQQAVLSGIRGQLTTPGTFLRLPWVGWAAPRTVRTDLRGLGMSLLAVDMLSGGAGKSEVLGDVANVNPITQAITVSDIEKADAVGKLLGK